MANLVTVLATTHHPFFYRASRAPPESRPDFAGEWVRKVNAYRETLTKARPEVLVTVGSDHFHQLFYDTMPQFLFGANGPTGQILTKQALASGHTVVAVTRHPEAFPLRNDR